MNTIKTILIDLDGVLNNYSGNYKHDEIPEIKIGAKDFLSNLSKTYKIKLFTSRDKSLANIWLKNNNLDTYIAEITNIKEPAWLYIDDRCITFTGNYEQIEEEIKNFKPWYN